MNVPWEYTIATEVNFVMTASAVITVQNAQLDTLKIGMVNALITMNVISTPSAIMEYVLIQREVTIATD